MPIKIFSARSEGFYIEGRYIDYFYKYYYMAFLVHNLPPIEVYVKKEYLYDHQKGHGELVVTGTL